jgi:hypothetical protein
LVQNAVCVSYNNGRGAFGPVQQVHIQEGDAWSFEPLVLLMANM